MAPPVQPTLPLETQLNDAERQMILETPSIFPKNQDSNFGYRRKIVADQVQSIINQQTLTYNERFADTSEQFLDELEYQVGLPSAPSGVSLFDRRIRVKSRLQSGVFTNKRIVDLIEPYIQSTFGTAPRFSPSGLSLVGGVPLLADASGDPKQYYRIYYSPRTFSYEVYIKSSVTPDILALTRDLNFITPAHMAMTMNNSLAEIIDFSKEVLNLQPVGYYKHAGNVNDSSGNGINGTLIGTTHDAASVAAPGLLNANVGSGNGALDFDGTDDYYQITISGPLAVKTGKFTAVALIRPDGFTNSQDHHIFYGTNFQLYVNVSAGGVKKLAGMANGAFVQNPGATSDFATGTTYRVAISFDGVTVKLWLGDVNVFSFVSPGIMPTWSGLIRVGATGTPSNFFNGVIDEPQFYDFEMTQEQHTHMNKARQNIYV